MQITRLRYTLPPSVGVARGTRRIMQHLEISERVNYGPAGKRVGGADRRGGGGGGAAIARTGRLAGHGVTVGILVDASRRSFTAVTCAREIPPPFRLTFRCETRAFASAAFAR